MAFICIILFIGLAIYIKLKRPTWKGRYSEKLVHIKMLQLSDEYIIFNDFMCKINGRSTQIDHIVVSPYGVFVIETKGYKGWILGGENSEYWTQVLYKNKYKLYNPIKQNEGHVRFLRQLLKCPTDFPIIPIVVFDNSADLKVHVTNHIVVNRCNLNKAIFQYKDTVLSPDQVEMVVNALQQHFTIVDKEEIKQHKHNVQNIQHSTKALINQGVCPQCGGQLLLRRGKYGSFYGCSNYPRCKFTMNK